eukprot:scaffold455339_cov50-Prasinocladus_malaysianus.AAC.3
MAAAYIVIGGSQEEQSLTIARLTDRTSTQPLRLQLCNSNKLRRVLQAVLTVGNSLNEGTKKES